MTASPLGVPLVVLLLLAAAHATGSQHFTKQQQPAVVRVQRPTSYLLQLQQPVTAPRYYVVHQPLHRLQVTSPPPALRVVQVAPRVSSPPSTLRVVQVAPRVSSPPSTLRVVQVAPQAASPAPLSVLQAGGQSSAAQSSRGRALYLSWLDPQYGRDAQFSWHEADAICRRRGQQLISIETQHKSDFVNDLLRQYDIKFIWTSGRRPPAGSFAWATGRPVAPLNWSHTGKQGQPQPDNREGGEDCLAVLNNHYQDGVKWHDVQCHHRKSFICE